VLISEKSNKVWVIDFDWSGKEGEARYPFGMNHMDIAWPKGASDGELMKQDHDLEFFKAFFGDIE
jgi:hypothetical protein